MVEISLMGRIDVERIEKIQREITEALKTHPNEEITLILSSPGGGLGPALAFYEWVRLKNIPLTTIAIGEVSSAAVIVFLAGKKRLATTHTFFCLHKGGTLKEDIILFLKRFIDPKRSQEEREGWKIYRKTKVEIYKKETKLPEKEIKRALSGFLYLNPQEAKERGLISEIINI